MGEPVRRRRRHQPGDAVRARVLACHPHGDRVDVGRDDLAFLQYTGGTTGVSKGAVLTHGNLVANITQARAWVKPEIREGKEVVITPLPLYHIFALTANCLTFSSLGALNILITNPRDIPNFVKELKKWDFTVIIGVNTLFNALLNHPVGVSLDRVAVKKPREFNLPQTLPKEIRLFNGKIGCGTCHNAFSNEKSMLVMNNYRSRLCLKCHNK